MAAPPTWIHWVVSCWYPVEPPAASLRSPPGTPTLPPFYVLVYVDDLVFATADTEALAHVKSELQKTYTCTGLGEQTFYLGLRITRDRAQRTITLTQSHMVQQVLQRFGFTYSSPQSTPLPTGHSLSAPPSDKSVEPSGPYPELVGCLMYLMTCTRPDLAYPLSLLARYVAPGRHRKVHWDATKRVLRYLCSTSGMGLVLGGQARVVLTGHADASWVDDLATQRTSQGYTFSLGSGFVSWRSTRSSSVLSSSCEAEIYDGAMAAQELRWLTYLLTDLGEAPCSPPLLYVDNKAMLALCQEHRPEHTTKHIALRYFLARESQQRGQLRLAYMASQANTTDVFTEALQPCDHQRFCTVLGLVVFTVLFVFLYITLHVNWPCGHLLVLGLRGDFVIHPELALPFLTGLVTSCSPPLCLWGDHFLSLDPTILTVDLLEQHLLAAETSVVAVGAARGTLRTPFFEGCSPSPLTPSYASAAAVDVLSTEDVGAAFASAKPHSGKGKGGRGGGGGSGSGGGGSSGGSGGNGGGGSGGSGGGSGGVGGGGGGSGGSGGSGSGGSGGGRTGAERGGSRGGRRQRQQRRSETPSPYCPYVICTGDRAGQTCGKAHTQHRYFSRLDDAWRAEFGDEVERPHWAELLRSGVAIFDLDYDAILSAMYALSASAEGDCYRCVPPGRGIEAAALGAGESSLPGTAPAQALHTFMLDSGASRCFFRNSTTLNPLPAPVPVRLADPSGGPVVARSSTVLPCPADRFGSLSGLHLPLFSTNLVSTAALKDAMVTTTTPGVRLQLHERFHQHLPVLRLHSDRGGEFSSDLLRDFCRGEGILQLFTLPDSPQQNGIAYPFPYCSALPPPPPLFLAPGSPLVDPLPSHGPAPSGVSQVDPLLGFAPVEVAIGSGAASGGAEPGGAESEGDGYEGAEPRGAEPASVEPGGAEPEGVEPGGAESEGAESGGAEPRGAALSG
ncbi:unnamed protein product, partial [Closterium sp. NIES-54]